MKKFLLSLAVLFTATFSANAQVVDTKPICGTYTCDFYLSMPDPIPDDLEPFPGTPVQILPGDEAGTINFFLQNFTMNGEVLGDVLLKNIKVQCDAEGKYTFVEHDAQRVELADGEIVADAKLNSATTYVKGGKLYADVDIVWIMNDVPVSPIYVRLISTASTAGIGEVSVNRTTRNGVYTLDGRFLGNELKANAPKGVYVVNGKKILK